VLVFQLCLGALGLLDYFGVVYYPMVHRVTEAVSFSLGFGAAGPLLVLTVAWCVCVYLSGRWRLLLAVAPLATCVFDLELGLSVFSLAAVGVGGYWIVDRGVFVRALLGVLTVFNCLSVVHWVFFVPLGLSSPLRGVAGLSLSVFFVLSHIAPLIIVPVLFMALFRPLVNSSLDIETPDFSVVEKEMTPRLWGCLVLLLLLGGFCALYPYLPEVNPGGVGVGVDVFYYVRWVDEVRLDWSKLFDVGGGSRPFMVLLVMVFQGVTGLELERAVWFLPVVLIPLMVSGVFFMVWRVFGSPELALWSGFFTATGVQVAVGMFAYFLTNVLALALIFFSLGLLFSSLRRRCYRELAVAMFLGGLALFTHPWTLDQFLAPFFVVAFYLYRGRGLDGHDDDLKIVGSYLLFLGFLELLRVVVFGGTGALGAAQTVVDSILRQTYFWDGSLLAFRLYYGGVISNVVLFFLVLVGAYVGRDGCVFNRYVQFFLLLTGVIFFFVDGPHKSRLVFNLPTSFLSSYGLLYVSGGSRDSRFYSSFFAAYSLNYVFMCLANLV